MRQSVDAQRLREATYKRQRDVVEVVTGERLDLTSLPDSGGECDLWVGATYPDGRPRKCLPGGKDIVATRWVFMQRNGLLREDLRGFIVSSSCLNKLCVNGQHLYLNKGANKFGGGDTNPNSKLTADDVSDIRRDYSKAQGRGVNNSGNAKEIMDKYGITRSHLSKITRRATWSHVE